ncbi:hypothetical protein N0V91_004511 [Didymella pomorum]|uniref:Uncharacterized protein n=1 Tax=Didymella pomorum TaxID=749634 RepID=A0A9W9D835_9PLEO|nr:hypothetical protein N0V91_004511 [Didymella pomorum]
MRTMRFPLTSIVALGAYIACVQGASQIALFTDNNCQDSYKGLDGPNGYPNGTCTDMRRSGEYGSLQVVGLDPGCAVTIYIDDPSTTVCGGFQEEIQLGQCWNSTFAYYSIDMCDTPSSSSATPTPSSSSKDSDSQSLTTGTLVGAVLGGLAGGALLLGIALWVLARKKRARKARNAAAAEESHGHDHAYAEVATNPYRSEMDGSYQRHEMEPGKVVYKHEVATPPVELAGWEVRRDGDGGQAGQAPK